MVALGRYGPGKDGPAVDGSRTERLIALMHAQRHEATRRSGEVRGTLSWTESSERLDALNDQIMHFGAYGSTRRETLGSGLELDLDSRPVDDAGFRRKVVDSMRHALIVATEERLATLALDRLAAAGARSNQTKQLIHHAQVDVRDRYPDAMLKAEVTDRTPDPNLISVRADRDGRAA
jgi:hypothetical protein